MEENLEGLAVWLNEDWPQLPNLGGVEKAASALNAGPHKCITLKSMFRHGEGFPEA